MIDLHEELLERHSRNKPIRIGLIGAEQMGTDVVAETSMMLGVKVVAVVDIEASVPEMPMTLGG